MRKLLVLVALAAVPSVAVAEVHSAEECTAAIAADPSTGREEAALWQRMGGGVPARLCEADALSALGAHATAARLLTSLAENPNRAIGSDLRATIFEDGAREWLAAERPDLARAALGQADRLVQPGSDRLILRARFEAADGDWPAARATLETVTATEPDNALAHALLAAAMRNQGAVAAALSEAERARALAPDLPEAFFEVGAALAESGSPELAAEPWLRLIERDPSNPLADLARRNLQILN
jgi:tetratricopeptide (TPR) repeat protein